MIKRILSEKQRKAKKDKKEARESAIVKLKNLGLTEQEIEALFEIRK